MHHPLLSFASRAAVFCLTKIRIRVTQFRELTFGFLNCQGDLARVTEVLVGIELDPELDSLAAEEARVDIPVLSSLE